jgi:hypothetical protein
MIGLYRQLDHGPAVLSTLLLDKGLTVAGDLPGKHGLAPLRAPDEVVDNEMYAVFVSLIVHVDIVLHNNTSNNSFVLQRWLKPWGNPPNLCLSRGEACGGFGSVIEQLDSAIEYQLLGFVDAAVRVRQGSPGFGGGQADGGLPEVLGGGAD